MIAIAIVTVKIVIEEHLAPFSTIPPALLQGTTDAKRKYAFNLDEPRGIKLLSEKVFHRLKALRGSTKTIPDLPLAEIEEDHSLYEHGLIKLRGGYSSNQRSKSVADCSLNVWLHITNSCNLGCFYCYIPQLKKHIDKNLGTSAQFALNQDTASLIVDRLEAYCLANKLEQLHVKFAGGEPTLAIEQIDHLCSRLRSRNFGFRTTFGILTNGAFDPVKVVPVLLRHNIKVSISIDGAQRNHDSIRFFRSQGRRVGTWDTIVSNVDILLESGIKPYFLYTITKKNLDDIQEFATFATLRACGFRFSLERAHGTVDVRLQQAVANKLCQFYTQFAKDAPLTIRFDRDAKFSEWSIDKKKHIACSTCRGYLAIGEKGQVSSCQMRLDEPVGHVQSNDLTEIFTRFASDQRTMLLRDPSRKVGACAQCEYRYTCAGGCPQHTRNVYGGFDRPSPWCFVYGTLFPVYIQAAATHLARRADHVATSLSLSVDCHLQVT